MAAQPMFLSQVVNPVAQWVDVGRLFQDDAWRLQAWLPAYAVNAMRVTQGEADRTGTGTGPGTANVSEAEVRRRAEGANSGAGTSWLDNLGRWAQGGWRREHEDRATARSAQGSAPGGLVVTPLAYVTHLEEAAALGNWRLARRTNVKLRQPDEILARSMARDGDDPLGWLTGLNWHEATALARLAGGRLPSVKELEHLIASGFLPNDSRLPLRSAFWTASTYNKFAFTWRRFDLGSGQWREPPRPFGPVLPTADLLSALVWDSRGATRLLLHELSPDAFSDDDCPMLTIFVFDVTEQGL